MFVGNLNDGVSIFFESPNRILKTISLFPKEVEIRNWNQGFRGFPRDMFRDSPFEDFFGSPGNSDEPSTRRQVEQGLGSGLIINEDGRILTNSHVISGADELIVVLSDGTEYKASVLGADPGTDIAVVKIEADGGIPIKRFVDGSDIIPNISSVIGMQCSCKKFDINQIYLSK